MNQLEDYEVNSENFEGILNKKNIATALEQLSEVLMKKGFPYRNPAAPSVTIVSEKEYESNTSENQFMELKIENKLLNEKIMKFEAERSTVIQNELSQISKRLSILEAKTAFISYNNPVTIREYDRKVVEINKKKIMRYIDDGREIDPLNYAELESIDIELSLLCFDELISEDKIERA